MNSEDNLFWRVMFEAPEDESDDDTPPDISGDDFAPDSGDSGQEPNVDDSDDPPDITGDDFASDDSFSDSDGNTDDESNSEGGEEKETEDSAPKGLDAKVSAILNSGLYKKNLALLSELTLKRNTIKDNIDIIRTLDPEAMEITEQLQRLEDNIREYNDRTFLNENYSKNRLFYDKCLNLYNLLCQRFKDQMAKAIKKVGNT